MGTESKTIITTKPWKTINRCVRTGGIRAKLVQQGTIIYLSNKVEARKLGGGPVTKQTHQPNEWKQHLHRKKSVKYTVKQGCYRAEQRVLSQATEPYLHSCKEPEIPIQPALETRTRRTGVPHSHGASLSAQRKSENDKWTEKSWQKVKCMRGELACGGRQPARPLKP